MWPDRGKLGPEVTVGHTARPELAGEGREVTLVVVGLDRKDIFNIILIFFLYSYK